MNAWGRQFGFELLRLFARKRTYIGFGVFLAMEVGVLLLLRVPAVQRSMRRVIEQAGYAFEDYYSGLSLAFLIIVWTLFLLGALYLALVGGDMVSKEVEEGTLRMILCRPISRARIISLKAAATVVYTVVLCVFICLSALGVGMLERGIGGMFVYAPAEQLFAMHSFAVGLERFAIAIPLIAYGLLPVSFLAFFFSCFRMKPAAATVLTLSVMFVDSVFKNIPFFEDVRHFFLTHYMGAWMLVFAPQIPWESILERVLFLAGLMGTLLVGSWLVLERRDFKS